VTPLLPDVEMCPAKLRRPRKAPPTLVVLHWTATPALGPAQGDDERMRRWLRTSAKSSTHLVLCRSGLVLQGADPRDEWTAHAGKSAWRETTGSVNSISVGVDLELVGPVYAGERGAFTNAYGLAHKGQAHHWPGAGWFEPATQPQFSALAHLLRTLREVCPTLREVVRHCDVSPTRKMDTGPVVCMEWANGLLRGKQ